MIKKKRIEKTLYNQYERQYVYFFIVLIFEIFKEISYKSKSFRKDIGR